MVKRQNPKERKIEGTEDRSLNSEMNTKNDRLPPGWQRYTVLIREENLDKLKALAFWSRLPLKAVLDRILEEFLAEKEIRPIPIAKDDLLDQLFKKVKEE